MSRSLVIDPLSERPQNASLELFKSAAMGPGIYVTEESYAPADIDALSTPAKEGNPHRGKPRLGNRIAHLGLYIVEGDAPASTNLATNPKAGVDLTDWTSTGLATWERKLLASLVMAEPPDSYFDAVFHAVGDGAGDRAATSVSVVSGRTYRFSAWIYLGSFSATAVVLQVRNNSGTIKATSSNLTTVGQWTRMDVSVTADSTSTWTFAIEQLGAGAASFYFTGVLIEEAPTVGFYFDGDTAGCSWSGAPNASSSARPAAGGTRMEAIVADLENALSKLRDEKGVLSRPWSNGRAVLDVQTAKFADGAFSGKLFRQGQQGTPVDLECLPIARGGTSAYGTHSETTLPVLIFTETLTDGSEWGLGDMVIAETQGQTRHGVVAAIQVRNYDPSPDAALFYQAESRTTLGGASVVTRSGASPGGTNNAVELTLDTEWQAYLSTQALGGANHLRHVGLYVVWARLYLPNATGQPAIRLEWSQGDLIERIQNEILYPPALEGDFWLAKLGVVRLERAKIGTQRWKGQLLAKSTVAGEKIQVDWLAIVPADEAYVELSVPVRPITATASSGVRSGGTFADDASGGSVAWTSPGNVAASDDSRATAALVDNQYSHWLKATNFGFSVPASSEITGILVEVERSASELAPSAGRYITDGYVRIVKGGVIQPADRGLTGVGWPLIDAYQSYGSSGDRWGASLTPADVNASGFGVAIAAVGHGDPINPVTARVDHIRITVYFADVSDAALYPGRNLHWRHDGLLREDFGGTLLTPKTGEGDPLYVPNSTREKRTMRAILFASRGDLDQLPDPSIDDLSAQLSAVSRYANVRSA